VAERVDPVHATGWLRPARQIDACLPTCRDGPGDRSFMAIPAAAHSCCRI